MIHARDLKEMYFTANDLPDEDNAESEDSKYSSELLGLEAESYIACTRTKGAIGL